MHAHEAQLVDQIYAAVQTPEALIDTYASVARHAGGFAAHYLRMDTHRRVVLDTRISDPGLLAAQADYAAHHVQVDSRVPWFSGGAIGQWRADQQRFGAAHVRRAAIYHDFLRPIGIQRMAACMLSSGTAQAVLCIARAHDAGDFSADDLQRLATLSGHLVRAAELRERLEQTEAQLAQAQLAHHALPHGALWLTATGRVTWLSPSAEALLASREGLSLQHGHLRCTDAALHARLQHALAAATRAQGREGGWLRIPRPTGAAPWLLSLIPGDLPHAPGHAAHSRAQVLVLLQDGAGPAPPAALQLQQLYGLTPAEARLALGLLEEQAPAEYALHQGLSLATVRTQLRSLLAKTGTRRQSELIRQLALPLTPRRGVDGRMLLVPR